MKEELRGDPQADASWKEKDATKVQSKRYKGGYSNNGYQKIQNGNSPRIIMVREEEDKFHKIICRPQPNEYGKLAGKCDSSKTIQLSDGGYI